MKRTQISTNVSELTRTQVDELMDKLGFSLRDVITLAIDRFYRQEVTRLSSIGYDVVVNGKHVATYELHCYAEARALIEKRNNPDADIEVVEIDLPEYARWGFGDLDFEDAPRLVTIDLPWSKRRSVK